MIDVGRVSLGWTWLRSSQLRRPVCVGGVAKFCAPFDLKNTVKIHVHIKWYMYIYVHTLYASCDLRVNYGPYKRFAKHE